MHFGLGQQDMPVGRLTDFSQSKGQLFVSLSMVKSYKRRLAEYGDASSCLHQEPQQVSTKEKQDCIYACFWDRLKGKTPMYSHVMECR